VIPRLGCDVVDITRLSDRLDRRPGLLDRVFTATEVADARRGGVTPGSPTERARLAARFAAKEATRKALGDLRIPFHATEVRTDPDGAPRLYLHGQAAQASLSLSHDGGVAMAVVALPPPGPTAPPPTAAALTHPVVTT
jgi:holo-[acyl-carrier protein] synthase